MLDKFTVNKNGRNISKSSNNTLLEVKMQKKNPRKEKELVIFHARELWIKQSREQHGTRK